MSPYRYMSGEISTLQQCKNAQGRPQDFFQGRGEGKQLRTPAIVHSIGLLKLPVLSFRKGLQLISYI